jgi:hypothetical protein
LFILPSIAAIRKVYIKLPQGVCCITFKFPMSVFLTNTFGLRTSNLQCSNRAVGLLLVEVEPFAVVQAGVHDSRVVRSHHGQVLFVYEREHSLVDEEEA